MPDYSAERADLRSIRKLMFLRRKAENRAVILKNIYMTTLQNALNALKQIHFPSTREEGLRVFYYSITATLSLLLLMITLVNSFPATFEPYLGGLLYNSAGGIYTDCSLRSNQDSAVCSIRKRANEERQADWTDMRRGGKKFTPFTLHTK